MLIYMITVRVDAFDRGYSAKAKRDGLFRSPPSPLEPGEPIIVKINNFPGAIGDTPVPLRRDIFPSDVAITGGAVRHLT